MESILLNGHVEVRIKDAKCKECGPVKESCKHATKDEIQGARQKLRHAVRDQAITGQDNHALSRMINEVYRDIIFKCMQRYRLSANTPDDDFQEVALQLVRLIRERKGEFSKDTLEHWTNWVGAVAKNVGGNLHKKGTQYKLRDQERTPGEPLKVSAEEAWEEVTESAQYQSAGPITDVMKRELCKLVRDMMERLARRYGRDYAEVLEMWTFKKMRIRDIAQELNISYQAARWKLEQARKSLRDLLKFDCETLYRHWLKVEDAACSDEEEEERA